MGSLVDLLMQPFEDVEEWVNSVQENIGKLYENDVLLEERVNLLSSRVDDLSMIVVFLVVFLVGFVFLFFYKLNRLEKENRALFEELRSFKER